jgi:predicted transcriptional regulator
MSTNYPLEAGFKADGASRIAAEEIDLNSSRTLALYVAIIATVLECPPMVPDQIADHIGVDHGSVRPRCTELKRLGLLSKETIVRGASRTKKAAHVFVATEYVRDRFPPDPEETVDAYLRRIALMVEARRAEDALINGGVRG